MWLGRTPRLGRRRFVPAELNRGVPSRASRTSSRSSSHCPRCSSHCALAAPSRRRAVLRHPPASNDGVAAQPTRTRPSRPRRQGHLPCVRYLGRRGGLGNSPWPHRPVPPPRCRLFGSVFDASFLSPAFEAHQRTAATWRTAAARAAQLGIWCLCGQMSRGSPNERALGGLPRIMRTGFGLSARPRTARRARGAQSNMGTRTETQIKVVHKTTWCSRDQFLLVVTSYPCSLIRKPAKLARVVKACFHYPRH